MSSYIIRYRPYWAPTPSTSFVAAQFFVGVLRVSLLKLLALLNVLLCEGSFLGIRVLIDEAIAFILGILVTLQLLALDTHLSQFILALHDE